MNIPVTITTTRINKEQISRNVASGYTLQFEDKYISLGCTGTIGWIDKVTDDDYDYYESVDEAISALTKKFSIQMAHTPVLLFTHRTGSLTITLRQVS